MSKIRAVAFDIDGTLYPNRRMYLVSARLFVKNFTILKAFQSVRTELRRIRPIDNFQELQISLMAKKIGKDLEETREIITREFYTNWEKVFHHINLYPSVVETLSWLKGRGLPLGVLSDFPVETKLQILNIRDYFAAALCSEATGYLKPAAEPFQELLKALDVEPQDLLYVGNSYEYDVLGASRLGIRTAHISHYTPAGSPADITFSSYSSLMRWIKEQV